MTNKQERYYVISEKVLSVLIAAAKLHSDDISDKFKETFQEAEAACRARPVPPEATSFAWEVAEADENGMPMIHFEEIKK